MKSDFHETMSILIYESARTGVCIAKVLDINFASVGHTAEDAKESILRSLHVLLKDHLRYLNSSQLPTVAASKSVSAFTLYGPAPKTYWDCIVGNQPDISIVQAQLKPAESKDKKPKFGRIFLVIHDTTKYGPMSICDETEKVDSCHAETGTEEYEDGHWQ